VAEDFCFPARPFQERDLHKYRRIWLNAPFNELKDFLATLRGVNCFIPT
jgi:hypothetical protein